MKYETYVKIEKLLNWMDKGNDFIIVGIFTVIVYPFALVYVAGRCVDRFVRGKVYDSETNEWITKKEKARRKIRERQKNREVPLVAKKHVSPNKDAMFLFFEKRKLKISHDKLVYVETVYNEKLHLFFDENEEWFDTWQKWHGWDIGKYEYEDIREGMFYPQDFSVFKHGFLWRSPMNTWDKESGLHGEIHYYYELDPDSEIPLKNQMEHIIRQVYGHIDFF